MTEITKKPTSMRAFYITWFGQLVSTLGSGLTGFAIGIYIYEKTNSTTMFAINSLAFMLPGVLLSPVAGALADRYNRRMMLIISDAGAGLSTLVIWLLLLGGNLEVWHIWVLTAFSSAFNAIQFPTYGAAVTMMVPKEHLGRAGGMVQIGQAISQLVSPAIAGAMFLVWGMKTIVMIDFATFGVAVLSLILIRIPEPVREHLSEEKKGRLWRDIKYGWTYIIERKGLLYLLLYFAFVNLLGGAVGPLFLPLILEMGTSADAGYVSSTVGLGMLVGTLIMSAWGGPKRRVNGVLVSGIWSGLVLTGFGFMQSLVGIAVGGAFYMMAIPIMNGSSQALWQTKTPADVQGRVFSVRRLIGQFTAPIGTVLGAPLVDNIFQPLMNEGGVLAGSIGQWMGVGPGRGAALLISMVGAFTALGSASAYLVPRLRLIEDEIPDVEIVEQKEKQQAVVGETVTAD